MLKPNVRALHSAIQMVYHLFINIKYKNLLIWTKLKIILPTEEFVSFKMEWFLNAINEMLISFI